MEHKDIGYAVAKQRLFALTKKTLSPNSRLTGLIEFPLTDSKEKLS